MNSWTKFWARTWWWISRSGSSKQLVKIWRSENNRTITLDRSWDVGWRVSSRLIEASIGSKRSISSIIRLLSMQPGNCFLLYIWDRSARQTRSMDELLRRSRRNGKLHVADSSLLGISSQQLQNAEIVNTVREMIPLDNVAFGICQRWWIEIGKIIGTWLAEWWHGICGSWRICQRFLASKPSRFVVT